MVESMAGERLFGVGVSAGRAAGPVVRVVGAQPEPASTPAPPDPGTEAARIEPAMAAVAEALRNRASRARGDAREVLETTAAMAADPALRKQAERAVLDGALPAARAVYEAANGFSATLAAAGGYLAERVRDVQDVRDRIVAELLGVAAPGVPELTRPAVLVARDLAPADTAGLDPSTVLALVTEEGGPTSHTAILARSLGIPAVVACRGILDRGELAGVVVDGDTGTVDIPGGAVEVVTVRDTGAAPIVWSGRAATRDGHPVKILANVGSVADAEAAAASGAGGVGLFRTEFCYLSAAEEPTVSAQRAEYAAILTAFHGKPVVVRTLDAGADKPLPFLADSTAGANPVTEPNPALGVRGLRLSRTRVDVLDRQLDAIAGAAEDTGVEIRVMAPMVSTAEEARWFTERAHAAGLPSAGVMIEVPAAALTASEIFAATDFVSLGTNDLAQYLFAADRMSGALATLNDPWQPALLRLIGEVGAAASSSGKPLGVCGEAAADPALACVLIGLGVDSISMSPSALARVGDAVTATSFERCQTAARAVRTARDPAAARMAARAVLRR